MTGSNTVILLRNYRGRSRPLRSPWARCRRLLRLLRLLCVLLRLLGRGVVGALRVVVLVRLLRVALALLGKDISLPTVTIAEQTREREPAAPAIDMDEL